MPDPDYSTRKELARANRAFYHALEQLDLAAMKALWLDDPRVRCVHPGGEILVGPERVLAGWAAIFASTQRIHFDLSDLTLEVLGDVGWASHVERIRTQGDEGQQSSEAAATNLFVMSDGRWRLMLHHASPIARRFFRE